MRLPVLTHLGQSQVIGFVRSQTIENNGRGERIRNLRALGPEAGECLPSNFVLASHQPDIQNILMKNHCAFLFGIRFRLSSKRIFRPRENDRDQPRRVCLRDCCTTIKTIFSRWVFLCFWRRVESSFRNRDGVFLIVFGSKPASWPLPRGPKEQGIFRSYRGISGM
jgi:hypothetical protein